MKKFTLIVLAILGSISGWASHIKGGQITWTALGNDQYVFHMDMYTECNAIPQSGPVSMTMMTTGSSLVTMNFLGQTDVSPACTNCQSSEMVVRHFSSDTITVPAPTGSQFWEFSFGVCCWPASTNIQGQGSYYFRSRMYAGGANKHSPEFVDGPDYWAPASGKIYTNPMSLNGDSIYVDFAERMQNASTAHTYNSGYTYSKPVGTADHVNGHSGIYYPTSGLNGAFGLCFSLAEYSAGSKNSEVFLDFNTELSSSSTNNAPAIILSSSYGPWSNVDSTLYRRTIAAGDSIRVHIQSQDGDFNPNFVPQQITASAVSSMAGTYLTSVSPQGSLTNPTTNNVYFGWRIPANTPSGTYRFIVKMTDDNCPINGTSAIILEVEVNGVANATYPICAGDSTWLYAPTSGSTYSWTPTTGLSNPNAASTMASPSQTTTYSIYVDGALAGNYTIDVGQNSKPLVQVPNPLEIELTNPGDFDEHAHTYYFVPFAIDDTIVTVSAPGLYHVIGRDGGCYNISDSVVIAADSSASILSVRGANAFGSTVLNAGDEYGQNLDFSNITSPFWTSQLILPGAELSGKTGSISVDFTVGSMTYAAQVTPVDGHSLRFDLPTAVNIAGQLASWELRVDTGSLSVRVMEDLSFPRAMMPTGEISSVSLLQNGTVDTDDLIPLVIKGNNSVGLEEHNLAFTMYPQPAKDYVSIRGLEGDWSYEIVDMNGRVISSGEAFGTADISTEEFIAGLYFVRIQTEGQTAIEKLIVQ